MYTVGKLAKKYGLSRSTLLYYDYIGLLRPIQHTKNKYRQYSDEDAEKLDKICAYREAGLSLKNIAQLLNSKNKSELATVLEQRLDELSEEMITLQNQQQIVVDLLNKSDLPDTCAMNKDTWKNIFQEAGISTKEMQRWHVDFERISPDKHARFLRFLNIPEEEIGIIRAWSSAPQKILKLKKASEDFMTSFFHIYEKVDRKGPGDYESTQRAFKLCKDLPDNPSIIDIGCGNGRNAIDLASLSNANIIAVDIYEPYLQEVQRNAKTAGLSDRIITEKADMADLCYHAESFDLIWSEGAAYIMGFDAALKYWKKFLKPNGYIAISEAVWLKQDIPEELLSFWTEAYPMMRDSKENIKAIKKAGYKILGNFIIPQCDWDIFYDSLETHINNLETEYTKGTDGHMIIELTRREIELYRKYKGYYGYEFYIMQQI